MAMDDDVALRRQPGPSSAASPARWAERERIERDVRERAGVHAAVQVEHRRQVAVVAPARLGTGALETLPEFDRAGGIREVDHVDLRFLAHGVERGIRSAAVSREFRADRSSGTKRYHIRHRFSGGTLTRMTVLT